MDRPVQAGAASGPLLLADSRGHTGLLITHAAASGLHLSADGAQKLTETYEHYPPIAARVYVLR